MTKQINSKFYISNKLIYNLLTMNDELKEALGFLSLGLLGVLLTKVIGVDFQSYISFLTTGMVYLLYKTYEESK